MPCECEGCQKQLARAVDFGRIYEELERPSLLQQLIELNRPILDDSYFKFMLAVWRANESLGLTNWQRLQLFRFHYKEPKIETLDTSEPIIKPVKQVRRWVEL